MVDVLYEDNHIIVVIKPQNIPSQSDESGDLDMLTMIKQYIKEKYNKPGNAYVGLVHRLDRPTGGIMVFAKTSKSAKRLCEQIKTKDFQKKYLCVVCGSPKLKNSTLIDYLKKDEKTNIVKIVPQTEVGAKKAELDYELIDCIETKEGVLTWVLVILHTGRHHQIRVQFASRGLGLYGDTKYNPKFQKTKKKYTEIGLYSTRLSFNHPVTGERMTFKTEPSGEAFEKMDVEAF